MIKREIFLLFGFFSIVFTAGFDSTTCGKTKSCVSVPSKCYEVSIDSCDFILGHVPGPDGKTVEVEIHGKRNGGIGPVEYVAAGFSEDERMGNEPVSACVMSDDGPPKMKLSYNPGTWNEPIPFTEENVKLLDSAATDEYIYCKFLQAKDPANERLPDFDKSYQILAARGPRSPSGDLSVHNAAQSIPDPVDLTAPPPEGGQEPEEVDISDPSIAPGPPAPPPDSSNPNGSSSSPSDSNNDVKPNNENGDNNNNNADGNSNNADGNSNNVQPEESPKETAPVDGGTGPFSLTGSTKVFLVKLHGIFMLIGWFGMVAIAIFSARYLRPAIPYSKINGLHVWFHLHRGINIGAVVLIILATVLIFVAKDLRWTGPRVDAPAEHNLRLGVIHSIVGLVAVIIGFLQPFGALLRCGPDHPRRPIFTWIHRSFGFLGILLAVVAVFLALVRFTSLWSDTTWPRVIFILYVILAVLIIAGLEIYEILRVRRRQKFTVNSVELQGRGKFHDASEVNYRSRIHEKERKDKILNLIFYFIFAAASIATVVLLALFLL
ncbi:hypothetical protein FO519_007344 [Halicephalobus sp. NKZ332]|nr:hypothetical protein FO519_007344 [Halicephalobus sp. NKZ332]